MSRTTQSAVLPSSSGSMGLSTMSTGNSLPSWRRPRSSRPASKRPDQDLDWPAQQRGAIVAEHAGRRIVQPGDPALVIHNQECVRNELEDVHGNLRNRGHPDAPDPYSVSAATGLRSSPSPSTRTTTSST